MQGAKGLVIGLLHLWRRAEAVLHGAAVDTEANATQHIKTLNLGFTARVLSSEANHLYLLATFVDQLLCER